MPRYASNIQIPNLPVAVSLSGAEQVECVQAGMSSRTTTGAIANAITSLTVPNVTSSEKTGLTATTGRLVFDTDLQKLCVYTATGWQTITSV